MNPAAKAAIRCPECQEDSVCTIDSRGHADRKTIRRRRECPNGHRFTTLEKLAVEWHVPDYQI